MHQGHKRSGFARLRAALGHQRDGLRHAWECDPAVRQVSLAVLVLVVVAAFLPVSAIERVLLIYSVTQVLVVELVNSSIEATVDRISEDLHPLSKVAKDYASLAVGLSALLAMSVWVGIVFPMLVSLSE
jgi:diacylglycerol kinase (ATP)